MSEQSRELTIQPSQGLMHVWTPSQSISRFDGFVHFVKAHMRKGIDYGVIPGTTKPTLLQPGAAKILAFYGLEPRPVLEKSIERWDLDDPLFYYLVRFEVWRGDRLIGWAHGSANSRESRYAHRWVAEHELPSMSEAEFGRLKTRGGRRSEYAFAIEAGQTEGQYGKPQEYWDTFRKAIEDGTAISVTKIARNKAQYDGWEIDMTVYCVPNPDIFDQVNTLLKIAEKRGKVACALVIGLAHEFFGQDLDDIGPQPGGGYEEGSYTAIDDLPEDTPAGSASPALATDQQFAIIGDLLVEAGTLAQKTREAVDFVIRRQGYNPDKLAASAADKIIGTLKTAIAAKAGPIEEPKEPEEAAGSGVGTPARQKAPPRNHWAVAAGDMFLEWAKLEHKCSKDQVLAYLNQAEGIKIEELTDSGFTLEMAQRAIETAATKEQAGEEKSEDFPF